MECLRIASNSRNSITTCVASSERKLLTLFIVAFSVLAFLSGREVEMLYPSFAFASCIAAIAHPVWCLVLVRRPHWSWVFARAAAVVYPPGSNIISIVLGLLEGQTKISATVSAAVSFACAFLRSILRELEVRTFKGTMKKIVNTQVSEVTSGYDTLASTVTSGCEHTLTTMRAWLSMEQIKYVEADAVTLPSSLQNLFCWIIAGAGFVVFIGYVCFQRFQLRWRNSSE